jgi:long-chain acyl-CoA synthetase
MLKISDLLLRQTNNDSIAIKYGDKILCYSNWNKQSLKVAQNIRSKASSDSLNIALFLPNSINYAIAYFAVQFSNKIIVPIDIQSKAPEIVSTLQYCEIDLVISDSDHIEFLKDILNGYDCRIDIYNIASDEIVPLNGNKAPIPEYRGADYTPGAE